MFMRLDNEPSISVRRRLVPLTNEWRLSDVAKRSDPVHGETREVYDVAGSPYPGAFVECREFHTETFARCFASELARTFEPNAALITDWPALGTPLELDVALRSYWMARGERLPKTTLTHVDVALERSFTKTFAEPSESQLALAAPDPDRAKEVERLRDALQRIESRQFGPVYGMLEDMANIAREALRHD